MLNSETRSSLTSPWVEMEVFLIFSLEHRLVSMNHNGWRKMSEALMRKKEWNKESGMTPEERMTAWEKEDEARRERQDSKYEGAKQLRGICGFQSGIYKKLRSYHSCCYRKKQI